MDVTYISACGDASGYAEAARNYIAALDTVGVNVDVIPTRFEQFKSDLGKLGDRVMGMMGKKLNSKIQIIHLTPENYPGTIKKNRYNIAYAAWETSKLPPEWVGLINQCDEVWVPCKHNVEVFRSSGVKRPIVYIPHTFAEEYVFDKEDSELLEDNETFTFYSVFQWTERKNPLALLKAYLTEFKKEENVHMIFKTYLQDPRSAEQNAVVKNMISSVKQKLYLDVYPRLALISSLMSRAQIQSLHKQCDCYVSPHRCEGFGIPIAEAMIAGNPVIVCGHGGPEDFIIDGDTGLLIDYNMTPVFGMPFPNYTGDMVWAEPDIMDLKAKMRWAFENRKEAKEMGDRGKEWIKENLSWEAIGQKMKERLEQIEKELL